MWQLWHRRITNTGGKEIKHRADLLCCPLYHLIAKSCSVVVDWFPGHRVNVKSKCDFQHWEMENKNSLMKPKANQSKQLLRHFMRVALCYIATSCSSFRFVEFTPPQQKACSTMMTQTSPILQCAKQCVKKTPQKTLEIASAGLNNAMIHLNHSQSLGAGGVRVPQTLCPSTLSLKLCVRTPK